MVTNWIRKLGSFNWPTMVVWLIGIMLCYGSFIRADVLYQKDLVVQMEKNNSENNNLARSLAQAVNHTFNQANDILLFMKTAIEANGVVDYAHLELLKTIRDQGVIDQIAVVDTFGDLLFSAASWPLKESINISNREDFKAHIGIDTGQVFISSPRITQVTGTSSIYLSRRLNDVHGNFAGIVSIGLNQNFFQEEFHQMDISPNKSIVLIKPDGTLLASISPLQSVEQVSYFKTHVTLLSINRGRRLGVGESQGSEESPRIATNQVLPDYPAVIMVATLKETAHSDIIARHNNYRFGATVFSALLLLSLALLSCLGRKQYKTHLVLQASDLERKAHEEVIRRMAYCDTLTGLPNRAYFMEYLGEVMKTKRQGKTVGALLLIDVDDLKIANDSLGHSAGDKIIITVGKQIVIAAGDHAIVARIGGGEFIVLLSDESDRDKVAKIASDMTKRFNRYYDIGNASTHISVSIGMVLCPVDGDTGDDILKKADLALHAAKEGGKNTWCFYEASFQEAAYEKMLLKRNLSGAMERGELSLYYQPIVEAGGHRVVGFEALLRWISLSHGLVPPSQFIPLAEESDSILKIGKWVIEEACRFARKLSDMGKIDLRVAVNVSPRQLPEANFVSFVRDAIQSADIHPSQLQLEITENVLITSVEDSVRTLNKIRALGVSLSLDDFGTGYSSLHRLRQLPVSTLKIDKSFIDQILIDEGQLPYIHCIVNMAKILGLTVVAEGVETRDQMEKLAQCQCDYMQGYLFSRPLPEKDALLLLDKATAVPESA